ncbi:MAG: PIN domain-containing protein [Clostridiales bacterium]|jgi:predicted nucleic acid-binding protein|nr:PIN domain-containing protein [Clostridiales bacterium]
MLKVYLDNCCFNRPYDDQSHLKIELETRAKLRIQELIVEGKLALVISYMSEYENDDNPYLERRMSIEAFFRYAIMNIDESNEILSIAKVAKSKGLKTKDALHFACAIAAGCDFLITTDAKFLRYYDSRVKIVNPIHFITDTEGF